MSSATVKPMRDLDPEEQALLAASRLAEKGIRSITSLEREVQELYEKGLPRGDSTGWPCLDEFISIAPGLLTIVTGWPSSGKSEFIDALLVNLARDSGWRFAVFSPENHPHQVHVAKLVEKVTGKPFGAGPNERVTKDELRGAIGFLHQHFAFIDPRELSVSEILTAAENWIGGGNFRKAKVGLLIDPWNEVEHARPRDVTETEYIGLTLGRIRRWAREWHCHVWVVAHPHKFRLPDGELPIPRPDSISGSQHWWNKADVAITVHRDLKANNQEVQIHVQKARFKHIGKIGLAVLLWDRVTGRYYESLANDLRMRRVTRA